jgi:hypothetical protein
MNIQIQNAIIKSAELSSDDHGCLTAWIHLEYGCRGQGFGGYALYLPSSWEHHEIKSFAGHFIWRVMEVCGVTKWSQLPGKTVRVKAELAKVHAIGHIIKNDWFEPAIDFASFDPS